MGRANKKTGRNEPCLCGSSKKYKHCCLRGHSENNLRKQKMLAINTQRIKQQGLGEPITSEKLDNLNVVSIGKKKMLGHWETFHDFLSEYIKYLFGRDWWCKEQDKDYNDRHQILSVYEKVCNTQKLFVSKVTAKGIYSGNMTGACSFYYWLAYNLYVIAHNEGLADRFIERLKKIEQFPGACYEAYVASIFIKAGFFIDFEDEGLRNTKHCEFIATCPQTGKKYGVEAKQRNRASIISPEGSSKVDFDFKGIGRLLKGALEKDVVYERIIFIDVNLPSNNVNEEFSSNTELLIKAKEQQLADLPPAYVFFTNYPYHHDVDEINHFNFVVVEGFKIDDFYADVKSLRQALASRDRHKPIYDLFDSIKKHSDIPSTFDGSIPEFTFGDDSERLIVGNTYEVQDENGDFIPGVLEDGVVLDTKAWCVFRVNKKRIIGTFELTGAELSAYQCYPDTFFGVPKNIARRAESPLQSYDFLYNTYRESTKEFLMQQLKPYYPEEFLQRSSKENLAKIYSERLAHG